MLTTCSRPVRISQIANRSIPKFLVIFMLPTSSCGRWIPNAAQSPDDEGPDSDEPGPS
jgi:hypothetical protein